MNPYPVIASWPKKMPRKTKKAASKVERLRFDLLGQREFARIVRVALALTPTPHLSGIYVTELSAAQMDGDSVTVDHKV